VNEDESKRLLKIKDNVFIAYCKAKGKKQKQINKKINKTPVFSNIFFCTYLAKFGFY
jgi:uncharacterized protein YmfQ (DUF2313 family)